MLRHTITSVNIRGAFIRRQPNQCLNSFYHTSKPLFDEGSTPESTPAKPIKTNIKATTAQIYNNRRAAYNRAVGKLRKQYAQEVLEQRKQDEKEEAEKRAALTRKRLERQRLKNIRSVKHAMLQEEERKKRLEEFQKELDIAQANRDARRERYEDARRLVLKELEEEAVHWLTTPEEVDATFKRKDVIQKLWTRPGGYVGAPMPCEDTDFWKYQSHTWDMSKNLVSPRDLLLEEIEEEVYYETNVDKSYWTRERVLAAEEKEEKAKLRAMVREEGRKALLLKQRRMMQDVAEEAERAAKEQGLISPPRKLSVPSLKILSNMKALEREGAKILEEDPTKFFHFESTSEGNVQSDDGYSGEDSNTSVEEGNRHLGKPIGLRDPLRDSSPTGTPFPLLIGRIPKPDTRTEREKKRDEREEKMWAAAEEASAAAVEFAAEDEIHTSDPVDYDEFGNRGDDVDFEYESELDEEKDADKLAIPREKRYSKEDLDWVVERLQKKVSILEDMKKAGNANGFDDSMGNEVPTIEDQMLVTESDVADALGENVVKSTSIDERGREYTSYDVLDDDDDYISFDDIVDMNEIESVLESFSEDQREVLESLETGDNLSVDEMRAALTKVPGISDEQIQSLIDLELSLSQNEKLVQTLEKMDFDK